MDPSQDREGQLPSGPRSPGAPVPSGRCPSAGGLNGCTLQLPRPGQVQRTRTGLRNPGEAKGHTSPGKRKGEKDVGRECVNVTMDVTARRLRVCPRPAGWGRPRRSSSAPGPDLTVALCGSREASGGPHATVTPDGTQNSSSREAGRLGAQGGRHSGARAGNQHEQVGWYWTPVRETRRFVLRLFSEVFKAVRT